MPRTESVEQSAGKEKRVDVSENDVSEKHPPQRNNAAQQQRVEIMALML
jgi:hypothetical protein